MGKELKRNEQKNAILDDVMNYLRNKYETDVEKIRKGDFKVKPKKVLPDSEKTQGDFVSVPDGATEEIPFKP